MQECSNGMTLDDCELMLLRSAMDTAEEKQKKTSLTPEVREMVRVVQDFLRSGEFICYGGTAINNILPREAQFYINKHGADYDFFSKDSLKNSKRLADSFAANGFNHVEVKSSMHVGTFKVIVNSLEIADVTELVPEVFEKLDAECIKLNGIKYASPDFLRQSMYRELSLPEGQIDRWPKVLKRLSLLNKHYPFKKREQCRPAAALHLTTAVYDKITDVFIKHGCVFIGASANAVFQKQKHKTEFEVLATNHVKCLEDLKAACREAGVSFTVKKHPAVGELLKVHYEVLTNGERAAMVYEPAACHAYNVVKNNGRNMRVGTFDTLLAFLFAFLYTNRPYHDANRVACTVEALYEFQKKNQFKQHGLLKRFVHECYGKQLTKEDIRVARNKVFNTLRKTPKSRAYEMLFLKYEPRKTRRVKRSCT